MKRKTIALKEYNGPVEPTRRHPIVELVSAPVGGTKLPHGMLDGLIKTAKLNKVKRLLLVFER